ncbi:MAG: hypothetical protein LKE64_01220 [Solobacterium sp.]|jgi:hypothetical protein|nr:hypothetical protein [Solobacterium sp.]MCH4049940.1 hypothetical protein [Solobacterium sp.]MCH4073625.1 hypothetical protein [Solobacterium sp.]MCI1314656.1 hypothetical protein [Solobacterium sp.]MCI1408472.1 hypothetical protein [Solobacterium sp.]
MKKRIRRTKSKYLKTREIRYFFLVLLIYSLSFLAMYFILALVETFVLVKPMVKLVLYLLFFVGAWALTRIVSEHKSILEATRTDVKSRTKAQRHASSHASSLKKEKTGV